MDKVLNTNGFPNIQIPPAPPNTQIKNFYLNNSETCFIGMNNRERSLYLNNS